MEVGGECHAPASLPTIKNTVRRVSTAEHKNQADGKAETAKRTHLMTSPALQVHCT